MPHKVLINVLLCSHTVNAQIRAQQAFSNDMAQNTHTHNGPQPPKIRTVCMNKCPQIPDCQNDLPAAAPSSSFNLAACLGVILLAVNIQLTLVQTGKCFMKCQLCKSSHCTFPKPCQQEASVCCDPL